MARRIKRIADRKLRKQVRHWLSAARRENYANSYDGRANRVKMFRRSLGF